MIKLATMLILVPATIVLLISCCGLFVSCWQEGGSISTMVIVGLVLASLLTGCGIVIVKAVMLLFEN